MRFLGKTLRGVGLLQFKFKGGIVRVNLDSGMSQRWFSSNTCFGAHGIWWPMVLSHGITCKEVSIIKWHGGEWCLNHLD